MKTAHLTASSLIILYIILLLAPLGVRGQSRVITGTITDSEDQSPVPNCRITILNSSAPLTYSDVFGKFSFDAPGGAKGFSVALLGYTTVTITFAPGLSDYAIRLEPSLKTLDEVVVTGSSKATTI